MSVACAGGAGGGSYQEAEHSKDTQHGSPKSFAASARQVPGKNTTTTIHTLLF